MCERWIRWWDVVWKAQKSRDFLCCHIVPLCFVNEKHQAACAVNCKFVHKPVYNEINQRFSCAILHTNILNFGSYWLHRRITRYMLQHINARAHTICLPFMYTTSLTAFSHIKIHECHNQRHICVNDMRMNRKNWLNIACSLYITKTHTHKCTGGR